MQYELMRILAVMADPLSPLESRQMKVGWGAEIRAERLNKQTEPRASAREAAMPGIVRYDAVASVLSHLFCAVAAKWWLLFSIGSTSRR